MLFIHQLKLHVTRRPGRNSHEIYLQTSGYVGGFNIGIQNQNQNQNPND